MGWIQDLLGWGRSKEEKQAEALNKQAVEDMAGDRLDEAERRLLEAQRLAPDLAAIHHNLGALYVNTKRYSQALKQIRHAIRLDPTDIESQLAIARIYGEMGREKDSLNEYVRICGSAPEDWRAQISLGNALLKRKSVEEAIEHLEKAARLKPKEELPHLMLAAAHEQSGDLSRAIREYEIARRRTKISGNRAVAEQMIRELRRRQAESRSESGQDG